jgi:hypothetical protein
MVLASRGKEKMVVAIILLGKAKAFLDLENFAKEQALNIDKNITNYTV